MPPSDLTDIREDLDEIKTALGGDQGIRVRLAVLEQRIAGIETGLKDHRQQSTENHQALQAGLKDVADRATGGWRISIDPASGRALGAFVGAVLAAMAAGGGIASALTQAATTTPAAAQHAAPAVP